MRSANLNRLCTLLLFCCAGPARGDHGPIVELFDAMDTGQLGVKFIPASAARANVLLTNNTDHVLHVQLPSAFAAVPVLAQFAQGDFGAGGGQNGGGTQGVGGGMEMQGMGNGNFRQGGNANGLGMGFMRIAPRKMRKLTVQTVCLEHGKPDPHPRIAYRMIPITRLTDDPQVAQLCRQLGRGQVAQKPAQAAAWHLANGLSWKRLAAINRMESKYFGNIKLFRASDLEQAREIVDRLGKASSSASMADYVSRR